MFEVSSLLVEEKILGKKNLERSFLERQCIVEEKTALGFKRLVTGMEWFPLLVLSEGL